MGALFRVPIVEFDDAPRPWIALVPRGGATLGTVSGATFVLGAEREGLPDEVIAGCDAVASIPLAGPAESLNVAMVGTVALYELARRSAS